MPTILDSYSEANQDDALPISASIYKGAGQSFTVGTTLPLYSAVFYLWKTGSPTGNAYAKIYSMAGTYGTNATPTGSPLATSDPLDVTSVTSTPTLYTLTFSGNNRITMSSGSRYVVTFEFAGGNGSNFIVLGAQSWMPAHSGNTSYMAGSSWTGDNSYDTIFYVYGNPIPVATMNFLEMF